ncbi:hypothetical protein TWF718_008299 [Orbilia javanica]|uniref:Uncharacterized protein n=1 Tax=Orbilia javanica TaxID=47235 RepID=A0AAN8MQ38_9PEZI
MRKIYRTECQSSILRLVAFVILFFILSTHIPLASAAPYNPTLRPRTLLNQVPLININTPVLSRTCRTGFYHTGENIHKRKPNNTATAWEGFPLGQDYNIEARTEEIAFQELQTPPCRIIRDTLGDGIADAGIEFGWGQGYCGCTFWFLSNCTGDFDYLSTERLSSVEPYKLDLRDNNDGGSHLGKFQSFQCYTDPGWRPWSTGKLYFSNGGDQDKKYNKYDGLEKTIIISKVFINAGSTISFKSGGENIDRYNGQGSCISVSDEIPGTTGITMRQWEIENCTCSFWTNNKCEGNPYLIDGTRGVVSRKNIDHVFEAAQQVRSFRCDAPYGPPVV